MPYNPTAENIATYLLTEVSPKLVSEIEGYDVQVTKVIVWETENSFAEVSFGQPQNGAGPELSQRTLNDVRNSPEFQSRTTIV